MSQSIETLNRLIEGFRTTALIATAVRLKIVDALNSEPQLPQKLASTLRLDESSLTRLLRGLALLDLVEEHAVLGESIVRYSLTSTGLLLRSDADGPLASYALLSQNQYLPAWTNMEMALKEGRNPFQSVFGKPVWHYRQENPEEGDLFNRWLHGQSSTVVDEIVAAFDFSSCKKIADVAGGKGILLARTLQKFSNCRGVLAEQPSVLKQAEGFLQECGLRDRCDLTPTDFFAAVPEGCDAYLLKSILHDWDDADSVRILGSLRKAMSPSARFYIVERILPTLARDDPGTVWMDLMMMNITGGRERTLSEYESLLQDAGLSLVRSISTASQFQVMEVAKR